MSERAVEGMGASIEDEDPTAAIRPVWVWVAYLAIGVLFGVTLIKSEVASWYRIQEMFRFHSFHLYGVLGSAVLSSWIAFTLLGGRRAASGASMVLVDKAWEPGARTRYALGGLTFGVGWGLVGSCPGPIYALLGSGFGGALVALVAALVGTRAYVAVMDWLPH